MAADLSGTIENQWLSDCAIFPLDKFLNTILSIYATTFSSMCLIDKITLFSTKTTIVLHFLALNLYRAREVDTENNF